LEGGLKIVVTMSVLVTERLQKKPAEKGFLIVCNLCNHVTYMYM